jgi:hypothetical protein
MIQKIITDICYTPYACGNNYTGTYNNLFKYNKKIIMKLKSIKPVSGLMYGAFFLLFFSACQKESAIPDAGYTKSESVDEFTEISAAASGSVVLVIDEESIDNGNPPNNFSEVAVNDHIARIGQRATLTYFKNNIGKTITLYTGDVGDEGWHALKTIPTSWINAGPTNNGTRNYLQAGPGLGSGEGPEVLLDKIPNVTPLRATGLKMLIGQTILAVVYDGDVSINYGPLQGNLQGANNGMVALEVLSVTKRTDGSSGSLPKVSVKIKNVEQAKAATLKLFSNAPVPKSSSEPFDINPPASVPAIKLVNAR